MNIGNRTPALIFGILVIVAALTLGLRAGTVTSEDLWSFEGLVARIANSIYLNVAAIPLTGALCYAHSRSSLILKLAAFCTAMALLVTILEVYYPTPMRYENTTLMSQLLQCGVYLFHGSNVVTLLVLLSVRFQGGLERARRGGLILLGMMMALQPLLVFSMRHHPIFDIELVSQALAVVLLTVVLMIAGWAVAFRQMPPHRPPQDAGKTLALTCPRCHKPQHLTLPSGECSDCRLKIFVALNEGTCANCGYPLRGLTGGKCPECGTPFMPAQAQTVSAAPPESSPRP